MIDKFLNVKKGEDIHKYVDRLCSDVMNRDGISEVEAKKFLYKQYQDTKKNERRVKRASK